MKNHSLNTMTLDREPIQILKYKEMIGIIYKDKIEILNINQNMTKGTITMKQILNEWNIPLNIKRISCNEDRTFILTDKNEIFTCRNVFITEQITRLKKMKIEIKKEVADIRCHDVSLFILYSQNESTFDDNISKIEKYRIDSVEFLYSFDINGRCIIIDDYIATEDSLIHLSTAPFLILKDSLSSLLFKDSILIGVSPSRIYYIESNQDSTSKYELSYEMKDYTSLIDPNCIKIPDFIKDERQRRDFLDNEILLRKYEITLDKINEIDIDLESRERQDEEEYLRIKEMIESIERRTASIEERISEMKKRAERSMFRGDTRPFYEKIRKIEEALKEKEKVDLKKYKMKLMAQREILRN